MDSRSNRPIEARGGEGGVLRWDAEGEAVTYDPCPPGLEGGN